MHQAHAQLRRKKGYKQALQKASKEEKETPPEVLPEYPTDSNMEMETLMIESKFTSIMSKSSTDVGQTNLYTTGN